MSAAAQLEHASPAPGATRPLSRLGATSGVAFVIAFNLALFDLGAPPKASDSSQAIASILVHAHGRILAGMYLAGVAVMLGVWFFSTVQAWLAEANDPRSAPLATMALAGGLCAIALGVLGMLLYYGASYKVAGEGGLPAVRAMTDAGNAAIELTKFPLAMFILAVSVSAHRDGRLPRWLLLSGAPCVVVLLASAIPLFAHGSFTQFVKRAHPSPRGPSAVPVSRPRIHSTPRSGSRLVDDDPAARSRRP